MRFARASFPGSQKIILAFGCGLIILLITGITTSYTLSAMIAAAERHDTSHETLALLENLLSSLKDVEGGETAYVITGKDEYLALYREALARIEQELQSLRSLITANPDLRDAVDRVARLAADEARFTGRVVTLRRDKGRSAAMTLIQTGRGRSPMTDIRKIIIGMEAAVSGQIRERDLLVRTSTKRTSLILASASLVAILLLLVAGTMLMRELTKRLVVEKELSESEESFRLLIDGIRDYAVISLDRAGRVTGWNTGAERIYGYGAEEVVGKHVSQFCPADEVERGKPDHALQAATETGRYEEECWQIHKNGTKFWAHFVMTALHDEGGGIRGFSRVTRDISDRRRSEESMKKLSLSVEQATDLIILTDPEGKIEYVNKAVEDITGYSRGELVGKTRDLWRSGEYDEKFFTDMKETLLSGKPFQAVFTNRKRGGELFYVYEVITPLKDPQGVITHFVSTGRDITQQRALEERLNNLSYHDALTGIANRTLFIDRLSHGIARARYGKKIIVLLIVDINRFKYINDGYGLTVGDRVLKAITDRLSASVRDGDTVARLGSDDFGILLFDVAQTDDIILVVKKIMEHIVQPIPLRGEEIVLTASLGVAVYPHDGETPNDLLKSADIALTKAKQEGRNNYQFYTRDMNIKAMEFVSIDKRLLSSYKNREFTLYYQPYWDVNSGKLMGMEALIRWNSADQGVISPDKFIPVLEDTGMIIEVGDWITSTVCTQIRKWRDAGHALVPISVNISSVQFRKKDLAESIIAAVDEAGIDPALITLEITESTFMRNTEFASSVFQKLKAYGISISLDDFGTGYSSLSYLKKFPFDNLKIDISFVRDLTLESDASTIVSAIIAMARSLNLKTIAEGVETEELWKILRLLKCDMVQGNYFSPALPPEGVEIYFDGGRPGQ